MRRTLTPRTSPTPYASAGGSSLRRQPRRCRPDYGGEWNGRDQRGGLTGVMLRLRCATSLRRGVRLPATSTTPPVPDRGVLFNPVQMFGYAAIQFGAQLQLALPLDLPIHTGDIVDAAVSLPFVLRDCPLR